MVSKDGPNYVKWHGFNMFSTFMHIKNYLDFFGLYFCFWVHMYITFVFTNTFQSLKFWNEIIHYNILFKLYSNIICKNIVKIFQNFEMGYIQTCTFLKKIQIDTPKGITVVCFHLLMWMHIWSRLRWSHWSSYGGRSRTYSFRCTKISKKYHYSWPNTKLNWIPLFHQHIKLSTRWTFIML
jgi:hypothetical protein